MAWIKRNLILVISGVLAVALLGFGGWYLWTAMQKNDSVDTEIGSAKADLERLMNLDPFPSPSNIATARREVERVNTFIAEAKNLFPTPPPPGTPLNNQTFKALLQTTVDEMHKLAQAGGIRVETNYYFSFEAQRLPVTFAPESLTPLSHRLSDVKSVASILMQAKVNSIEAVRRAPVPGESGSGNDYLGERPRTNSESAMVLHPYEFVFQAFSPELAAVMESLAKIPQAVVVRAAVVEPAEAMRPDPQRQQPGPGVPPLGRRGPGAAAAAAAPRAGLETVLNERALRVILKVDVITPMPPPQPGQGFRGPSR